VNDSISPGSRHTGHSPLLATSVIVGVTASTIAIIVGLLRTICSQLAHDSIVVRALALTYVVAGFMLARVAISCSVGARRVASFAVVAAFVIVALALAVRPDLAAQLYDQGSGRCVPWILGAPGLCALLLSRWRVT